MDKYINVKIMEFRNAIKNFVTDSPLPDEVKKMVLEQCLTEQSERTLATVRQEIAEREKAESEKEVENNAN